LNIGLLHLLGVGTVLLEPYPSSFCFNYFLNNVSHSPDYAFFVGGKRDVHYHTQLLFIKMESC
jgi:hypothetical protein